MPNVTVSVPEELKQELDKLPEVNWSEAVRKFLSEKVKRETLLRKLDRMLEGSTLTKEDADKFAVGLEREMKHSAGIRRAVVEAVASKSRLPEEEADRFAVELGREIKKGRSSKLRETGKA